MIGLTKHVDDHYFLRDNSFVPVDDTGGFVALKVGAPLAGVRDSEVHARSNLALNFWTRSMFRSHCGTQRGSAYRRNSPSPARTKLSGGGNPNCR